MPRLRVILYVKEEGVEVVQEFNITLEQWRWANVGGSEQKLKRAMLAVLGDREFEKEAKFRRMLRSAAFRLSELYEGVQTLKDFVGGKGGSPLEILTLKSVHGLVNVINSIHLEHIKTLLNEVALLEGLELPSDPPFTVQPILGEWFYDVYRIRKPSDRSG